MNNPEIRIFSSFYINELYRGVAQTENIDRYLVDTPELPEEAFAKGPSGIHLHPDFNLDPDKSDLENSIKLYEALKILTEVQASDERLWVTLTHAHFWNYMRKRWPAEKAKKPISRIRDRYFLRNLSLESLTRNGVARLWWYAHITHDANRTNPYELLEILMSRQDLTVSITERALGSSRSIRTGTLEFLKDNPQIAKDEKKTRELIKGLNLTGGVKLLPILSVNEVKEVLKEVSDYINL